MLRVGHTPACVQARAEEIVPVGTEWWRLMVPGMDLTTRGQMAGVISLDSFPCTSSIKASPSISQDRDFQRTKRSFAHLFIAGFTPGGLVPPPRLVVYRRLTCCLPRSCWLGHDTPHPHDEAVGGFS
jgi:hypothetical protein